MLNTPIVSNPRRGLLAGLLLCSLGGGCSIQEPAPVEESAAVPPLADQTAEAVVAPDTTMVTDANAGGAPEPLAPPPSAEAQFNALWAQWNSADQARTAFRIFDNLYYVGIDWVAAYVLQTSEGLILIDSLYGRWVEHLIDGIIELGLNPNDIRYVLVTHGHFDHAGGAWDIHDRYGATVVMTDEDWALARKRPERPEFAFKVPPRSHRLVARDGGSLTLGNTTVEFFKTPGHTEGVLSLRYPVRDGKRTYTALTLGGVGLNFSGERRTRMYLASYARLRDDISQGVSVSLPNHAEMGDVFERAARLKTRRRGDTHPFVDAYGVATRLREFISNAEAKLEAERNGTAGDPMDALLQAVGDD